MNKSRYLTNAEFREIKKARVKERANRFPEKIEAKNKARCLTSVKGKIKHHWSYKKKHYKDVIYLTYSEHSIIHHKMIYLQERKCYISKDCGTILDTKEKALKKYKEWL
jgi:hypothetical protein